MNLEKVFIVIPTIRNLNFLRAWGREFNNCSAIIVEDHSTIQVDTPTNYFIKVYHYSWKDIDAEFKKNTWIFPRKNAGIRSYGFYKAYQLGAKTIITLDDDCFPTEQNFVQKHVDNLNFKGASNWFATYPDPKWMYTRGFPYKSRNKIKTVVSHGLWSGALDLDGKTETKLPKLLNEKPYPPMRQFIPKNYFFPMCSMNLAFRREIVPLMYFPPMGSDNRGKSWNYDRYDDIWAGLFVKKVCDHLGLGIVNGSPFVEHRKASKASVNRKKEASGLAINEALWKSVAEINLTQTDPKSCYIQLAHKMKFPRNGYFSKLREAMIIWANLF